MTATLEHARARAARRDRTNSAPFTAGELLCELLEAVETLENHVLFGEDALDDSDLAVSVIANLGLRIRKQALEEELVKPLGDRDGTYGRLTIGDALMAADSAMYAAKERAERTP